MVVKDTDDYANNDTMVKNRRSTVCGDKMNLDSRTFQHRDAMD